MVTPTCPTSSYFPPNWPTTPFHAGELKVQKLLGVQEQVNSYAPRVVRPCMPDQHRSFYQAQPFLVIAARDARDKIWSSLLFASDLSNGANNFVSSPDQTKLIMDGQPLPGDALEGSLQAGSDLGILGIEFATQRRNRVNGRISQNNGESIAFKVDQSFGNCPQYIKPRDWWVPSDVPQEQELVCCSERDQPLLSGTSPVPRANRLTKEQIETVRAAESIFVATGYRGEGDDPRFGNDASHRGGQPGFLDVHESGTRIFLPDYSGNNHYNTIGNLVLDNRMGISIPVFQNGGMIQMTGTAIIHWDDESIVSKYPGAKRVIEFQVDEVVELPVGSLPIRWDAGSGELQLQIYKKVKESDDVTSFYFAPISGESPKVPSYKPGQHLTLQVPVGDGKTLGRSYSISEFATKQDHYRISVKRDPFGVVSRYLHDNVQVDDIITVEKPSGDFVFEPEPGDSNKVLFLSAGIGATPLLSMLHAFALQEEKSSREAIWVHSARDGHHHCFQQEIAELQKSTNSKITSIVGYTKPANSDAGHDFTGRISRQVLESLVTTAPHKNENGVDVYICGPGSFVGDMEELLLALGVPEKRIQHETF